MIQDVRRLKTRWTEPWVALGQTNRSWVDDVVYGSGMVRRLLESHEAATATLSGFALVDAAVVSSAGGIDHASVLRVGRASSGSLTVDLVRLALQGDASLTRISRRRRAHTT